MSSVKARSYLSSELAILASLVLHVLAFLGWQNRATLGRMVLFRPLAKVFAGVPARPKPLPVTPTITFVQEPAPQRAEDRRRQFIETDASQVTGEEPKNARFYSANSTVAANPDNPSGKTGDTPYLDGQETRLASTANVHPQPPSNGATAPAPRPAKPQATSQPVSQKKTDPVKKLAETGMKVDDKKQMAMLDQPVEPAHPVKPSRAGSNRAIATAKSRATTLGVSRIGISAFNVAGGLFGEYDKALIFAVQSRWHAVLEEKRMDVHAGTVVLQFDLRADGTVANMTTKENNVGFDLGLYCEKAIVESAPFAPYTDAQKRLIGSDAREIMFTFYY